MRNVERELAAVENPKDRAALKAAIERTITDWRETLAGPHFHESRAILQQLVGPIRVLASGRKVVAYDVDSERIVPDFPLPDDESITVQWTTTVNMMGLIDAADHNRVASPTGPSPFTVAGSVVRAA
jgi:hypothetical protein